MNCTAGVTVVGLWFLVFGSFAAGIGIRTRLRTKVFDRKATPTAVGGALAAALGIWVTVAQIRCGFPLPNLPSLIGPLKFTYWPPQIVFVIFAAFVGFQNSKALRRSERFVVIAFYALCGFVISQGAAFHTGIEAKRWFVVFVLIIGAGALAQFLYTRRGG